MAEIIDVITNLTYQVEDAELAKAAALLQQQVQNVGVYATRLQNLQQTFDRTASSEIEKRNRIAGLIQRQKNLIDQTNVSITKQVTENQKLQTAIIKEVGLINTLTQKIKILTDERNKAFDVKQIDAFNRQIAATQGQLGKLTGGGKGTGFGASILQGLGIGTGVGLVTQGIGQLQQFIGESVRLATEAEGVFRAFDRLNSPNLLENLRTSVRGTVSDLELAKQAVQFNNFGLPIEKLGIALGFARQRAQDTGQSIDFLVQSIVTGIGRQSPLILDNLGINAKRVSEEFKRTGNFAEAAFNIIQVEAAKAGNELDTFGDRQARLNARIENFQVRAGEFFKNTYGELIRFLETGGNAVAYAAERTAEAAAEQIAENLKKSRTNLDDYLVKYQGANLRGQQKIKEDTIKEYVELEQRIAAARNQGLESLANSLAAQRQQYDNFFRAIQVQQAGALDFNNFTASDLQGLSKSQLEALKEEGETAFNPLAPGDRKQIQQVKYRLQQVNDALDTFAIKKEKSAKVIEKPIHLRLEVDDGEKFLKDIEKTEKQLEDADKIITDIVNKRRTPDSAAGFQSFNETLGLTGSRGDLGTQGAAELNAELEIQKDVDAATKKRREKEKEDRKRHQDEIKEGYTALVSAATNAFQLIYESRLRYLDLEVSAQQDRVNQARLLAEKGNSEQYDAEVKRLNDLQAERQKIAQQQLSLNAVLQASNAAVALTEAIGAIVGAASKGDPYTIAARVAAAVAALISGVAAIKTAIPREGFKDGVVGYEGKGTAKSDSNTVRISRGESVITAEATQKYRTELEAMNNGTYHMLQAPRYPTANTYNSFDTKGVESKLDRLTEAVEQNRTNVKQVMDAYGLTQTVETLKRRDAARFK